MRYEEFPPSRTLVDVISSYWQFSLPADGSPGAVPVEHTVPPDGAVNICWVAPGRAAILGPRIAALRVLVIPGFTYLGARFHPGAGGALLGVDARTLRDNLVPFPEENELFRAIAHGGIDGLDKHLQQRIARPDWQGVDPVVREVTRRIVASDGTLPVSELIADLNLSYRQVLRRFHQASGLTLKEFARLRRLRAACLDAIRCDTPRWAGISADAGFSDQAHLAREFSDIYGWPPRLVHEYLRRIQHVALVD
jgi:AraC-like DNA-binding protein